MAQFIQPKIEAEIVCVLGETLAGPGISVADASLATAGVAAAMEIVDSRIVDWRIKLADTVADLASNGAAAISSRIVPLAGLDPPPTRMMFTPNGALSHTRRGAAAPRRPPAGLALLGHPAWPSRGPA